VGILRPRLTERAICKSGGDAVVDCRGPSDLISLAGHIHHLLSTPLTSFAFGVLRQVRTLGGQSPRTPRVVHVQPNDEGEARRFDVTRAIQYESDLASAW
jgi:hypothetical protein